MSGKSAAGGVKRRWRRPGKGEQQTQRACGLQYEGNIFTLVRPGAYVSEPAEPRFSTSNGQVRTFNFKKSTIKTIHYKTIN
ncbi:hypothetical protein FJU30_20815 [Affinibrenneria salicis]|uniref:Uncharacterized protein n=1 Tax=Affinibrenneria salicis TaxID=2590031 RepID=A0A5J5FT79_9GAMM|nr:hypothetical protein [Affinibrenneria salicis]KAA8996651.1 hypothetical protein FJU30_20815 [Affinibrenneria salicis]